MKIDELEKVKVETENNGESLTRPASILARRGDSRTDQLWYRHVRTPDHATIGKPLQPGSDRVQKVASPPAIESRALLQRVNE